MDTIKKSRMTPPTKHKLFLPQLSVTPSPLPLRVSSSTSLSPLTPQPLEELLASAYTAKRRSFQSDRLLVGQVRL